MTYQRLPYDDAATTDEMVSDSIEVGRELHMPLQRFDLLGEVTEPAPAFGQHPYVVSPELAELAAGLELHFD
jgi:hypothetical protein